MRACIAQQRFQLRVLNLSVGAPRDRRQRKEAYRAFNASVSKNSFELGRVRVFAADRGHPDFRLLRIAAGQHRRGIGRIPLQLHQVLDLVNRRHVSQRRVVNAGGRNIGRAADDIIAIVARHPSDIADIDPGVLVLAFRRQSSDPTLDPAFDDADLPGRQPVAARIEYRQLDIRYHATDKAGIGRDLACRSIPHQAEFRGPIPANDILADMGRRSFQQGLRRNAASRNDCAQAVEAAYATREDFDRVISINLRGVWSCMKFELRQMLKQGTGTIVNCSSIGGVVAGPNRGTYQASKHGVLGLTKSAALDYAARGIRINAVCPGIIQTSMLDMMMATQADALNAMLKDVPIGRLGRPEEIASAVLWLCSSAASFIIGHALVVDGGYTIR